MAGAASPELETAYRAHAPAVFRRARRILGDAHEAEEIVQEVFEALAVDAGSLARAASPAGWFYASTTNRCINRLRDAKNRLRLLHDHAPSRATAASAEDSAVLRELLGRLPEELAKVAVYYYGDEMTHEEIARLLDCSRRHVGDLVERLHEAIEASEGRS
jgi:RNA polymerase sigma factor (sigma-70 family)